MKYLLLIMLFSAGTSFNAWANDKQNDELMLTIFLKHDQSKSLSEIKEILNSANFYKHFPPEGATVESWKVMMGIGQVVTLRFPAALLPKVNLSIERYGWKAYSTEFYPTYDLYPIVKEEIKKARTNN
ncbi:hypothetical protein [Pseudoalteromonas sp. SWXJZ10B]|uniref:hypothetical protein n=1 Tax=Pseudoalteromonas sp. SWXJZ10B TaxID=2792063 RepID=UPI0018CE282E|nr:hypothetical protein [Pseudoalteromonas sp. SWXJZ10B]MBH0041968.1 hypothetical protein [Pseudoalteromonas sp. SWXJZ10B]